MSERILIQTDAAETDHSLQGFSPGDLLQVVLVAAGVLAILNLFLSPLQNGAVGLGVGRVREAGEAAGEGRPAGTQVEVKETC